MLDLLIKNGQIIDGSGRKSFVSDIGIKGDRIYIISPRINLETRECIDARGYVVCPGFIDIHSHSDFTLLQNPNGESKVRQGITTEVVGNCGFTAAPVNPAHFDDLMYYLVNTVILSDDRKKSWKWSTQADFVEQIGEKGSAMNIASLVGHGTIRIAVMGFEKRDPSAGELQKMLHMLQAEMDRGLFGMSTGLAYEPGSFATTRELVEMSRLIKDFGGIYATHMKSEGKYLLECISQAIEIARMSGVSVEISHFKAEGPGNWGKVAEGLKLIDEARKDGLEVGFDQYPYTAFGSGLLDLVPPWVRQQGPGKMIELLQNQDYRARAIHDMMEPSDIWENPMEGNTWDKVVIASVGTDKNKNCEGKDIGQISQEMGCSPYETVMRLLVEEKASVKMILFGMCEQDLETVMKHPNTIFCTDGRAVAPYGELARGKIHPRYYGTYPRILGRYVRQKNIIPLEEAIKKMTYLPAQKLKLKDRGLIQKGYFADITIFDRNEIIDLATFREPHRYPLGIKHVIVNGKLVVSGGEHTGKLPGRILRR